MKQKTEKIIMTTDKRQVNFHKKELKHRVAVQARHFLRVHAGDGHCDEYRDGGRQCLGSPRRQVDRVFQPLRQIPDMSAFVMAFNMAVPMAAWMRHRGMEWSPIAEMSGRCLLR